MKKLFFILILISLNSYAQDTITTARIKDYIGKEVWVKGSIASVKLATTENNVNYINVDKAFPNNVFTVVITDKYLQRLKLKLEKSEGNKIFVKGTITVHGKDKNETPQIFNPTQIQIK